MQTPDQAPTSAGITNLSSTLLLTPAQDSALAKGLSFIPHFKNKTHKHTPDDTETTAYHRRLKLAAHFHGEEREFVYKPTFQEPSTWEPEPHTLPLPLWDVIAADRTALKVPRPPSQQADLDNLTDSEWLALQQLRKDKSIIIKPADKGSSGPTG